MRKHPRYEACMPCRLIGQDGGSTEGLVKDISLGGAGITAPKWDGSRRLEIVLVTGDGPLTLPGEVVHSQPLWTVTLHTAFLPLNPSQHVALQKLLAELQDLEEQKYEADGPRLLSLQRWRQRLWREGTDPARVA